MIREKDKENGAGWGGGTEVSGCVKGGERKLGEEKRRK